jgi:hypothetical protein
VQGLCPERRAKELTDEERVAAARGRGCTASSAQMRFERSKDLVHGLWNSSIVEVGTHSASMLLSA